MTDIYDATESGSNTLPRVFPSTRVMHLLLPCDEGEHVLAEIGAGNVARLPSIRIPLSGSKHYSWNELERELEERFPFPVCLVKNTCNDVEEDVENPGRKILQDIWIVHGAGDFPPVIEPLKWVNADDVSSYKWPGVIRSFVAEHLFREVDNMFRDVIGTFENRAKPWEALGFYKQLTSWGCEILRRSKMVMEDRIRHLPCDGESAKMFTCCARMQNDEHAGRGSGRSEVIFFKCTSPMTREVERTVAVASVLGDIVPEIVGFDAKRGILMQRNAGKMTEDALNRETLVNTVLHIQRVSLSHVPELEAKGLRIMNTEWLESKIESILNHVIFEKFFATQEECTIECEEEREIVKSFRCKKDEFRKMCREISKLGLPNTIVHGDCYVGNVGSWTTTRDGKFYRLFDWADCHIGSPLVDLERILPRKNREVMSQKKWEAEVHLVCKEWKQLACLTYAEVGKVFDDMGCLQSLLVLYEWEELFDLCVARAKEDDDFGLELQEHHIRIFNLLEDLIRNFGDVNTQMVRQRDSAKA